MSLLRRYVLKPLSSPLARLPNRPAFFHSSASLSILKPFILADIGEGSTKIRELYIDLVLTFVGIKEVQIIQWFVEPEARVEQFDKICEVQSDKAAVEVCSDHPCCQMSKAHHLGTDLVQI